MKNSRGTVQHFLDSKRRLWNLNSFVELSIKFTFILLFFSTGEVSPCPLSLVSTTSSEQLSHSSIHHLRHTDDAQSTQSPIVAFHNYKRALSLPTSSMFVPLLTRIVKFLVKSLMGEQWLSEDVAVRRLDELKTTLFNYYARQNLFGGTVEQARDSGIGFPSLEGALLSLAFLTFSVFLIDLIQTVLNGLRLRNTTTVAPAAAAAILGRTLAHAEHPHKVNANSTYPLSMDMLTTLSSKVFSAIEKPWKFSSSMSSTPATTK